MTATTSSTTRSRPHSQSKEKQQIDRKNEEMTAIDCNDSQSTKLIGLKHSGEHDSVSRHNNLNKCEKIDTSNSNSGNGRDRGLKSEQTSNNSSSSEVSTTPNKDNSSENENENSHSNSSFNYLLGINMDTMEIMDTMHVMENTTCLYDDSMDSVNSTTTGMFFCLFVGLFYCLYVLFAVVYYYRFFFHFYWLFCMFVANEKQQKIICFLFVLVCALLFCLWAESRTDSLILLF